MFIYLFMKHIEQKNQSGYYRKFGLLDFVKNIFTSVSYCATCQQKVMASINSYKRLHLDHFIPGEVMAPVLKRVKVFNIMIDIFCQVLCQIQLNIKNK